MKLTRTKISYKLLFFISLAILLLCLIPMVSVSRFMVPQADDFSFSAQTHAALAEGQPVLPAALWKTGDVYNTWQGSYAAVFLMTLQPGILGYSWYGIVTITLMLGMLLAGSGAICVRIFSGIFGADRYASLLIAVVISVMATQFLPQAYQSFYWYNGSVYYTFFYGLTLFALTLAVSYLFEGGVGTLAGLSLLSAAIGGGNYVTALLLSVLLAGAVFLALLQKSRNWRGLLLALGILLIAMIISVTAPGNAVRQAETPDHPGALEAVLYSITYTLSAIRQWVNLPYFAMALVFLPVLWSIASSAKTPCRCPLLVSVLSFLALAVMQCPHIYATGGAGPARIQNIIYFAFLLLSMINFFWWFGWLQQKTGLSEEQPGLLIEILTGILAAAVLLIAVNKGQSITSVIALGELSRREAEGYYGEQMERLKILEDPTISDAELKPLQNTPILLFLEDLKDDPDYYANEDIATYYGKNSVVVKDS